MNKKLTTGYLWGRELGNLEDSGGKEDFFMVSSLYYVDFELRGFCIMCFISLFKK